VELFTLLTKHIIGGVIYLQNI